MNTFLRIGVIPLDNRPVNTRLVRDIARVAGIEAIIPPSEMLGDLTQSEVNPELSRWLRREASTLDAVVINLNQLVFGGYVASRRFDLPIAQLVTRLDVLHELHEHHPNLRITGYMTLMRTKDVNDGSVEPPYWAQYGTRIAGHSSRVYRAEHGEYIDNSSEVPPAVLSDFYLRRLRLHTVQLAAVEAVATNALDELVIAVEDSTVESVSTSEREWLDSWALRLGLSDRVRCYPGADEVASVLLAGILSRFAPARVRVRLLEDNRRGLTRIAPFEDVPLLQTIRHQARTAEVELVDAKEDFVLAVRTPREVPEDWYRRPNGAKPQRDNEEVDHRFLERIRHEISGRHQVILADVAQANGGDPQFLQTLADSGLLDKLTGYAGWNTAGNSLGTALSIGVAAHFAADPLLVEELLVHRILDDVGFQSIIRRSHLVQESSTDELADALEPGLNDFLDQLPGLRDRWRVAKNSCFLPWGRPFEIDFTVEPRGNISSSEPPKERQ